MVLNFQLGTWQVFTCTTKSHSNCISKPMKISKILIIFVGRAIGYIDPCVNQNILLWSWIELLIGTSGLMQVSQHTRCPREKIIIAKSSKCCQWAFQMSIRLRKIFTSDFLILRSCKTSRCTPKATSDKNI
jgi:hypothetical protein